MQLKGREGMLLKMRIAAYLLLCLSISACSFPRISAASTAVAVDPSISTVNVGDAFSVNVNVTDVVNLTAWQLNIYYLKALVNCTDLAEGDFLKAGGETYFGQTINNNYNSTHGRILAYSTLLGMISVNGGGVIVNATFKAVSGGRTALELVNTQLTDEKIPPQPIPHVDSGGTVIIAGAGHDVAVTDLLPYKTIICRGSVANVSLTCNISLAIANQGGYAETFNVTVFANTTVITVIENVNLTVADSIVQIVVWDPSSFSYGDYTLQAVADIVPGEADTADNTFTYDVSVHVGLPGDVSSATLGAPDGRVDMRDIAYLVVKFNTWSEKPTWNPNADVNSDGIVNMRDIAIAILNFNKHE
jgi:hypothetical protein